MPSMLRPQLASQVNVAATSPCRLFTSLPPEDIFPAIHSGEFHSLLFAEACGSWVLGSTYQPLHINQNLRHKLLSDAETRDDNSTFCLPEE